MAAPASEPYSMDHAPIGMDGYLNYYFTHKTGCRLAVDAFDEKVQLSAIGSDGNCIVTRSMRSALLKNQELIKAVLDDMAMQVTTRPDSRDLLQR